MPAPSSSPGGRLRRRGQLRPGGSGDRARDGRAFAVGTVRRGCEPDARHPHLARHRCVRAPGAGAARRVGRARVVRAARPRAPGERAPQRSARGVEPRDHAARKGTMTQPHESRLAGALLVLTAATGLIDAVSYLALGHVFTANMTGNVVFLAFAVAGAPGLSIARSLVSLAAFLAGAVAGGRLAARLGSGPQHRWVATAVAVEAALLLAAALVVAARTHAAPLAVYGVILLTASSAASVPAAGRKSTPLNSRHPS